MGVAGVFGRGKDKGRRGGERGGGAEEDQQASGGVSHFGPPGIGTLYPTTPGKPGGSRRKFLKRNGLTGIPLLI